MGVRTASTIQASRRGRSVGRFTRGLYGRRLRALRQPFGNGSTIARTSAGTFPSFEGGVPTTMRWTSPGERRSSPCAGSKNGGQVTHVTVLDLTLSCFASGVRSGADDGGTV